MVHTHIKIIEVSCYGNHQKRQDKEGANTIASCMLFQPDTKKFPEGDKEWKLPHMTRPK